MQATWRLGVALAGAALVVVACSDSAPAPPAAGPGGSPQLVAGDTPAPAPQSVVAGGDADACENLGALSGAALAANVADSVQWFRLPITGRPTSTIVGVTANGPASALLGNVVTLGAGVEADYATCTHCLAVAVGCVDNNCDAATRFFAKSGTAHFTAMAGAGTTTFAGEFSDVVLAQVTVDPNTHVSTEVAGGACFKISSLTFDATADGQDGGVGSPGDASSTDLDAGDSSQSSGGGGCGPKGCGANQLPYL